MFFLKKNFFHIFCLIMMVFSIFLGFNSYNILMMWISMEISLMSFIPQLILNKSILENYSMLKYFIFQCLGSSFFILGSMDFFLYYLMILGLILKLGIFPFHFWVLNVCKGLNWLNFFFLMSIQKILPIFFFIFFINSLFFIFLLLFVLNSLVSNLGSLNQMDLRFLFIFSSMNHMNFMIFSNMFSLMFFYIYLTFYLIFLFLMTFFLFFQNIYFFNEIFYLSNYNFFFIFFYFFLLLNFLGFPPIIGFFLKMMSLSSMLFYFYMIWFFVLLILNLFISFSYIRIMIFFFLNINRSVLFFTFKYNLMFFFFMLFFFFIY